MNRYLHLLKVEVFGPAAGPGGPYQGYGPGTGITGRQDLHSAAVEGNRVRVLQENEELLGGYLSQRRLSPRTRESYGTALRSFTGLVEAPLARAGRDEFEEWFRRVNALGLTASTIVLYTSRLRQLLEYSSLRRGLSTVEARAAAMIALEGVPLGDLRREAKLYERWLDKLLTPDELGALIREAVHPRARALLPVAYETACRKGELLAARIRDVASGDEYSTIRVFGKTGQRTLPLVRSVPALEAWLDVHPDPRPGAPLFATVFKGEVRRMEEHTPNRLMADLCGRAGLRRTHPHMLRHTRLTELAAAGIGEYVLKSFAGWTPSSKMAARYIHFSGRTHIPSILRLEGIAPEEIPGAGARSITDVYGVLGRILEEAGQEAEG